MKKIIFSILTLVIILNFSTTSVWAQSNDAWAITILDANVSDSLLTNQDITLYTGDTQTITHTNKPENQENAYLILSLKAEKVKNEPVSFHYKDISLKIQGQTYPQLENDFLKIHGYDTFTSNEIKFGTNTGHIIFEIPKTITDIATLELLYNHTTITIQDAQNNANTSNTNIEVIENIMDKQWQIEKDILNDYALQAYSLNEPYIVHNPYEWAPLTALALFETEQEAQISIKIQGKEQSTSVSKTFEGYNKSHNIPIVGLYADYENQIELTATFKDGRTQHKTLKIQTKKLPSDLFTIELISSNKEKMQEGMNFLDITSGRPVVVDDDGEVRWYLDLNNRLVFKRLKNGNILTLNKAESSNGRTTFYELDLLGKVYNQFIAPKEVHHDIIELPNGNFLGASNQGDQFIEDRIIELDRKTGEIVNDMNLRHLMNTNRFGGHQPVQNAPQYSDWFHINSLWYDESDSSIVVSGRYQGVIKISYPQGELKWILSEPLEVDSKMKPYMLTAKGEDFRWQVGQHAAMIMDDMDNNPDTLDLLLFDNNTADLDRPRINRDREFSRAVQYRIHEKNMTVEQIWAYGEERGSNYATGSVGDANYLDNGNVLITFGDRMNFRENNNTINNTATVIETTKETNAQVVFEMDIKFNGETSLYRAERLPLYPEHWNFKLGSVNGDIKFDNSPKTDYQFKAFDENKIRNKTTLFHAIDRINILNDTLNIDGWAAYPQKNAKKSKLSLVVHNKQGGTQIPLDTLQKTDVTTFLNEQLSDNINYNESGFHVSVPLAQLRSILKKGEYTIGVLIQNGFSKGYVKTNYTITIDPEDVFYGMAYLEQQDLIANQAKISNTINNDITHKDYATEKSSLFSGVKFKKFNAAKMKNKAELQYAIENIDLKADILAITGWAVYPEKKAKKSKLSLVFRNEKNSKYIPVNMIERLDVTSFFNQQLNNTQNYNHSGFDAFVPVEALRKNLSAGNYQIGIMIQNGFSKEYVSTPYTINIGNEDTSAPLTYIENQTTNTKITSQTNTLENPYILLDPYKTSPLTALVAFNTLEKGTVHIEIKGQDENTNISHQFDTIATQHTIPIYGLYADFKNTIVITFTDVNGTQTQSTITIQTDKLPADMQLAQMQSANIQNMQDGLTFVSSNYMAAYDSNARVRWYLSKGLVSDNATPITRLANGNLALISGRQVRPMYYQNSLYEIDLLGRVHNEYLINGIHHEIQELSNGNFIVAGEKDENTIEDYIVELDRTTGEIINSWDIGEILDIEKIADETYQNRNYQDRALIMNGASQKEIEASAQYLNKHDWFHNNAVYYVEKDNSILASGRMQDSVLKFDAKTKEIKWILADPNSEWGAKSKEKLLTPIGENFEWQYGQHAVTQLPNGDIMLYDNGNFRSKNINSVKPANENYSRAVIYRVNEQDMSVEQIWQYGKERGNELYTPYIGDVDYLAENHYLINFGGIIKDANGNAMDSPTDLFAGKDIKGQAVIVEIKDEQVVSEMKLTHPFNANVYRAERLPLYHSQESYIDFNKIASTLGSNKVTPTASLTKNVTQVNNEIMFETHKLIDEGDRLIANIELLNFKEEEVTMYLVLNSATHQKIYNAQSNSNVIINKVGLPDAVYSIGVLVVDQYGNWYFDFTNQKVLVENSEN